MREVNDEQRSIVMFHHDWCKKAVLALKQNKPVEPYHVFLSSPGGVGKSHVIKLIHSDTLKLLKLSGTFEPDDVIVLLTAPTGVAAFNIDGMTLRITTCCTADDFEILKSREIAADTNYPTQVLHVYRLNADVDKRNTQMLDSIAPQNAQFAIARLYSEAFTGRTGAKARCQICLSDRHTTATFPDNPNPPLVGWLPPGDTLHGGQLPIQVQQPPPPRQHWLPRNPLAPRHATTSMRIVVRTLIAVTSTLAIPATVLTHELIAHITWEATTKELLGGPVPSPFPLEELNTCTSPPLNIGDVTHPT